MNDSRSRLIETGLDSSLPADEGPPAGTAMTFGRYVALPSARTLLLDGKAVCLGARAFDLLILLLAARGKVVSKDKIMRYVWPSTTVDESNLRFQMTSLRKALGSERERIKTVTGRGYLFVAHGGDADRPVEPPPPERRVPDGSPPGRKPAIVIIDEDRDNREALHRLLRPFHAHVQSFVSIEAFLEHGSGAYGAGLSR